MFLNDIFTIVFLLQADSARCDILQSLHHRGNLAAMEVYYNMLSKNGNHGDLL